MSGAGVALRGASHLYAVGLRTNCVALSKEYGATEVINYCEGDIIEQILQKTHDRGVDKVVIVGGVNENFLQAARMIKPGGRIGNFNYWAQGKPAPCVEWECGMGHKVIVGRLVPGDCLSMKKLASLMEMGRLQLGKMLTQSSIDLTKWGMRYNR